MAYQRYIGRDYTAGNVTPSTNVAVSLGQPQKRWKEVYIDANSLHLGNVSFSIGKTNQLELMRTNKLGQPVANVVLANAVAKPLKVMDGGTGASTFTDGGVLLGSGAGAVTAMAVLTDGQMIVGDGTTDPVPESGDTLRNSIGVGSTASGTVMQVYSANASGNVSIGRSLAVGYTDGRVPQANLEVKGNVHIVGATTITGALTLGTDLAVAQGGTGASSFTDGHVLLGSGTSAITALNVTAKGSILAGDGTTDPVALAVGTNDQVLTAASGEASGLAWADVSAGSVGDRTITQAKLAENSVGGSKVRANVLTGGQIIGSVVGFQSNVTGNLSVSRSMAVGFTDGRIPQANLEVKGNVYISDDVYFSGANYDLLWDETTSKLKFYDNAQACYGDGNDLQIYHGGTHSFIKNSTGDLRLRSDSILLKNQADNETYLDANNGGSVDLYFDNTKKLETTGTGVSISGLGANVTGNVSVTRSMSIGYTDGKVPAANLDVNGTVAISDGTVALPSLINLGDVNTGIWFPAADTIATSVGGREAVRITGSARGGLVDSNVTISSNVVNHKGLATANYTEYANNITNAGSSFTVSTGTNMARYTLNASHCDNYFTCRTTNSTWNCKNYNFIS